VSMLSHVKTNIIDVSLKLNEKMFWLWKTNKELFEWELAKIS
jgi:hypothetical protein